MSGGHYEYAYHRIDNLAEHIKSDIDSNDIPDEYGYSASYSKETIENMKKLHLILVMAAKLAKEAEWLYSGDTGEDTFNTNFENIKLML